MTTFARLAAAAVAISTLAGTIGAAHAATFVAWKVADVPWGDTLNVRKYPASNSQKQSAYPNGSVLQMTGRCTAGVDLFELSGDPAWAQRQAVRYRWCEVWHDPRQNGHYVTGWVYGKFIRPM